MKGAALGAAMITGFILGAATFGPNSKKYLPLKTLIAECESEIPRSINCVLIAVPEGEEW